MTPRYYGNEKAIRQMPRHWHLDDPDAHWDAARSLFWLVVKTLVGAALVVVLYAVTA